MISKLDGEVDEKSAWLEANHYKLKINAEESGRGIRSLTISWYENYLKGGPDGTRKREFRHWDIKQAAKAKEADGLAYLEEEAEMFPRSH